MIDGNLDVEQSKLIVVTADRSNARGIVSGLDIWTPHPRERWSVFKKVHSEFHGKCWRINAGLRREGRSGSLSSYLFTSPEWREVQVPVAIH
jgi:hypothetical protein